MVNLPDFSKYGDVVQETPAVAADPTNPEAFGGLPKQGDTGDAVFEVQQALADRNISSVGEVDGAFGNKTSLGIQEFQGQVGLPRTGVLVSFDEEGKVQVTPIEKPDFSAFGEVITAEGTVPVQQETPVEPQSIEEAVQEGRDIVVDKIGIDDTMWDAYKKEVSKIESGGLQEPYKVAGGANEHYDGKYQLGKMAKADASQLLNIDLGHSKTAREAFRNDAGLQEKAFAAYTARNHSYLMNSSPEYRALDKGQQIAVLGFAHNQGWAMAKNWLRGGKEGTDAFGTKGSKYYNAITNSLGIPQLTPKAEESDLAPKESIRPVASPEEE